MGRVNLNPIHFLSPLNLSSLSSSRRQEREEMGMGAIAAGLAWRAGRGRAASRARPARARPSRGAWTRHPNAACGRPGAAPAAAQPAAPAARWRGPAPGSRPRRRSAGQRRGRRSPGGGPAAARGQARPPGGWRLGSRPRWRAVRRPRPAWRDGTRWRWRTVRRPRPARRDSTRWRRRGARGQPFSRPCRGRVCRIRTHVFGTAAVRAAHLQDGDDLIFVCAIVHVSVHEQ